MMRIIVAAFVVIVSLNSAIASEKTNADTPETDKNTILTYLRSHESCIAGVDTQFNVTKEKIGPKKSGYMGTCVYGGGSTAVIYEKKPGGVQKLLELEVTMNGNVYIQDKARKGYYDVFNYSIIGGADVVGDLYKWDGRKYVKVPEKN